MGRDSTRWQSLTFVMGLVVAFVACESLTPSPDPSGSGEPPSAGPTEFGLRTPFGTMRPPVTEPPGTTRPTPPPNPTYWTRVADMAEPRERHAAAMLPDGRVMVIGGQSIFRDPDGTGRDYAQLGSTEIFDPATGTWTAGPPLRDPRDDHDALALPDGRILVGGGSVSSVEIFDPETNRWSRIAELPERHLWDTGTLLADGRILVIGRTGRDDPHEVAASIFDPAAATWTATARTELLWFGHGTALLGDGTVLVVGGSPVGVHVPEGQRSAAIYSPTTDRWRDVGPMPGIAFAPRVTLLGDQWAIVMRSGVEGGAATFLYDSKDRTWSAAPHWGDDPFQYPETAITLADGRAMVHDDFPGLVHVFEPATGTWSDLGPFMELTSVPFSLLPDGRVLVAGGYHGCLDHNPCAAGEIAEAWLFDPAGGG